MDSGEQLRWWGFFVASKKCMDSHQAGMWLLWALSCIFLTFVLVIPQQPLCWVLE